MAIKFQSNKPTSVSGIKFKKYDEKEDYLGQIKAPVTSVRTPFSNEPIKKDKAFSDFRISEQEFQKTATPYVKKTTPIEFLTKTLPSAVVSGMADVNTGLLSTAKFLTEVPTELERKITGKNVTDNALTVFLKKAIEQQEVSAQPYREQAESATGPAKLLTSAVRSIPQILPAATGATQAQGLGLIGASAFGGQARSTEQQGGNLGKQALTGIGSAGLEIATEALPLEGLTKMFSGKGNVSTLAKNALQEFFGEGLTEALNPLVEGIMQGDDYMQRQYTENLKQTTLNALEAGATGALSSLLLGGAALGINTSKAAKNPTPENVSEVMKQIEEVAPIPKETIEKVSLELNTDLEQFFREQAAMPETFDGFQGEYNPNVDIINRLQEEQASQPESMAELIEAAMKNSEQIDKESLYDKLLQAAYALPQNKIDEAMPYLKDYATIDELNEAIQAVNQLQQGTDILDYIEGTPSFDELSKEEVNKRIQFFSDDISKYNRQLPVKVKGNVSNVPQTIRSMGSYSQLEAVAKRILEGAKDNVTTKRIKDYIANNREYGKREYIDAINEPATAITVEHPRINTPSLKVEPNKLYREVGVDRVESYFENDIYDSTYGSINDLYVAKDPTYALGQGDNQGIMLQFDDKNVPIVDVGGTKAGLEYVVRSGSRDYSRDQNYLRKNLEKIIVSPGLIGEASKQEIESNRKKAINKIRFNNVVINGFLKKWNKTIDENGYYVFENPNKKTNAINEPTTDFSQSSEQVYQEPTQLPVSSEYAVTEPSATNAQELLKQFDLNALNDVQSIENALQKVEEIRKNDPQTFLKMNLQLFAEKAKQKIEQLRKTATNTFQKSQVIPQQFKKQIQQEAAYVPVSNQQSLDTAKRVVESNPNAKNELLSKNTTNDIDLDIAKAEVLIQQAFSEGRNTDGWDLMLKMQELGTRYGREVQAISMLSRMSKEGTLYSIRKEVSKAAEEAMTPKKAKAVENTKNDIMKKNHNMTEAEALRKAKIQNQIPELSDAQIIKIEELLTKRDKAKTDRERKVFDNQAKQIAINAIPATFRDKANTIRRIMMLLNPKTQVRNVTGNLIMTGAENVAQTIATGTDIALSKITGERTTTLPQIKEQFTGAKQGLIEAIEDYKKGINTSYSQGTAEMPANRAIFKNKALNNVNNFLSFVMTLGDKPFYQAAYNEKIAEFKKLGREIDNAAIAEATEHALDITFQNNTEIAQVMTAIKKGMNKAEIAGVMGLGDAVIPFTRTPANIMRKGVQYTPVGTIAQIGKALKDKRMGNKFNQKAFVDSIGRGMTGTQLMLLGAYLASKGLATGDWDRNKQKKEATETQLGIPNFGFKVGDKYFTFDWAQPASIPLTVGIEFYNEYKANAEENLLTAIAKGFKTGGDTLLGQSMMQGLSRMLGSYSPTTGILDTLAQAPMQYIPSMLSQTARTIDPYQRDVEGIPQQVASKLPGFRQLLPQKTDLYGQPVEASQGRGIASRALENYILPYAYSEKSKDEITNTLYNLYLETGASEILPRKAPDDFVYKGEEYVIPQKDKEIFQKEMGEYAIEKIKALIDGSLYDTMSEKEKINKIKKYLSDAYDQGKDAIMNTDRFKEWLKQ